MKCKFCHKAIEKSKNSFCSEKCLNAYNEMSEHIIKTLVPVSTREEILLETLKREGEHVWVN